MPAVSDLGGVWQRLGCSRRVTAAAVASDDADLRLVREPGLGRRRLPIRQESNGFAPFQIADDGPIALISSPRPVVDTDHGGWDKARTAASPHDAQQRIVADRQHQPFGKGGRWPATQCKSEMMDDVVKPGGSPRRRRENVSVEALGEDSPTA
ncbi:hypothetical protein BA939_26765 [Rhizobium sp. S41]|nr:hypothetical protein BA939_03220 [Rhizobium sp. S41]ANV27434.1 hypothetical protein BA939_26765 [Rhizobium sp. S41]